MASSSAATFSNPFSLTDLFHTNKELHLGFQRQKGVGKGLGAWSGHTEALSSQARPVCPQSPESTCPPSPQAPGHPTQQPHHWGHIQRRQQPGELEAGRVDRVPVQGPVSETGASAVSIRRAGTPHQTSQPMLPVVVVVGGRQRSPRWLSEGKARDPLKETSLEPRRCAHQERRRWKAHGWGSSAVTASRPAQKQPPETRGPQGAGGRSRTSRGVSSLPSLLWTCSAQSQREPRWPGAPGTSSRASTAQGDTLVPAPGLGHPLPHSSAPLSRPTHLTRHPIS